MQRRKRPAWWCAPFLQQGGSSPCNHPRGSSDKTVWQSSRAASAGVQQLPGSEGLTGKRAHAAAVRAGRAGSRRRGAPVTAEMWVLHAQHPRTARRRPHCQAAQSLPPPTGHQQPPARPPRRQSQHAVSPLTCLPRPVQLLAPLRRFPLPGCQEAPQRCCRLCRPAAQGRKAAPSCVCRGVRCRKGCDFRAESRGKERE